MLVARTTTISSRLPDLFPFFFNAPATTEIYTLSLHDALPILSEAITVTATADAIINPNRTGSTSAVSEEQIEQLPTVNRQIQDFARTNPYFNTSLTGDGTFM